MLADVHRATNEANEHILERTRNCRASSRAVPIRCLRAWLPLVAPLVVSTGCARAP